MSWIDITILFIKSLAQLISWVVIIGVLLSYFMDPYHPLRRALDGFTEPMLAPIRRLLPPIAGLDFSPIVLLVIIQVLANIIIRLLYTLR
ncbi:MAG: YggT family protein [Chloroflexota bacterium]|nr:YggT family protein [Anaerolineales bacterium]